MARTTLYCCDIYVAGQRGKLAIGEHKDLKLPKRRAWFVNQTGTPSSLSEARALRLMHGRLQLRH